MITSKLGQQLIGLLLLAVGCGVTAWAWNAVLTRGSYTREVVILFPGIAVLGLAMFLFPIDVEQVRAEHGVDRPRQLAHYPAEWKVMLFVAVAAGLGNWLVISPYKTAKPTASTKPAEVEDSSRRTKVDSEPPRESSGSQGFLGSLWFWFRLALFIGGVFICLAGRVWGKTAELAQVFGLKANPDRGFWVAMTGFAMMVSGLALLIFFRS